MVQRWIKAAGPDVYLATLSLGRTVPRAIGDAGRGRKRNSVSVTKGNNCHAVAPFPGQASGCKSTSLLSHPLSPAGRAVESHSPVDYGLVCFGFNASSLGQSPWEEQEKEEGFFFFPCHGHRVHSTSAQICPSNSRPFAKDSNIPKTPRENPSNCSRLEEQKERSLSQLSFHPVITKACFSFFKC